MLSLIWFESKRLKKKFEKQAIFGFGNKTNKKQKCEKNWKIKQISSCCYN